MLLLAAAAGMYMYMGCILKALRFYRRKPARNVSGFFFCKETTRKCNKYVVRCGWNLGGFAVRRR